MFLTLLKMFLVSLISGLMAVGMKTLMPWWGLLVLGLLLRMFPGCLMVEPGVMLKT